MKPEQRGSCEWLKPAISSSPRAQGHTLLGGGMGAQKAVQPALALMTLLSRHSFRHAQSTGLSGRAFNLNLHQSAGRRKLGKQSLKSLALEEKNQKPKNSQNLIIFQNLSIIETTDS